MRAGLKMLENSEKSWKHAVLQCKMAHDPLTWQVCKLRRSSGRHGKPQIVVEQGPWRGAPSGEGGENWEVVRQIC